jgi:hypothetical protein
MTTAIHRFRIAALTLLCVAALAMPTLAQMSPARTATATIGGKTLRIQYSAPSVRGRQIFGPGGLLSQDPTYPVWRAGANDATTLRTDAALDLGGLRVPAGTYSLYVVVSNPDAWELVVNRQTGQSGLEYNARQDVGRVRMTMTKPAAPIEMLAYTLRETGPGRGELTLAWEQRVATVAFTVR